MPRKHRNITGDFFRPGGAIAADLPS